MTTVPLPSNTYKTSSLSSLLSTGDSPCPNSRTRNEIASAPVAFPIRFQTFSEPETSGTPSYMFETPCMRDIIRRLCFKVGHRTWTQSVQGAVVTWLVIIMRYYQRFLTPIDDQVATAP